MRYQKSFAAPASTRSRTFLPVSEWKKYGAVLEHVRPEGGALVLGEGTEQEYVIGADSGYRTLFSNGEHIITYSPSHYFFRFPKVYTTVNVAAVHDAAGYVLADGDRITYLITDEYLYYLRDKNLTRFTSRPGGTGLCIHKERVFFVGDTRLHWSHLYPNRGFKGTGAQESGYLDFTDLQLGKLLKIFSMGDYLYLFRERAVTRVYANADPLDFKAETFYEGFTNLHERSVACIVDKMYFFADGTLFELKESGVSAVPYAAVSEIDFSFPVRGTAHNGQYYASVVKEGVRQIYCYDNALGTGRYIGIENVDIIGLHGVHCLKENGCVLFEGSGLPDTGVVAAGLTYSFQNGNDKAVYLEAITVEGRGMFEVEARANGITRRAKGRAGTRLPLSGALAGDVVTLKIKPSGSDFAITGVVLHRRKETYGN